MATAWDEVADAYHDEVAPFTGLFVSEILAEVKSSQGQSLRVLDVAAGTGVVSFAFAAQGHRVVATDVSGGMCRALSERAKEENMGIQTVVCNGEEVSSAVENNFDIAISNFGCIFFSDPLAGVKEMAKAVRPGGQAIMTAWGPPSLTPAFTVIPSAMKRAGVEQPPSSAKKHRIQGTPEVLESLLVDAGLTNVTCRAVTRTLAVPSPERYWRRMVRAAPGTRMLLSSLSESDSEKLQAATICLLEEQFGKQGEVRLDATAFVVSGIRAPAGVDVMP